MKRSELVVGAELYYARERDWDSPAYSDGRGKKVTVVAIEPWINARQTWDRADRIRQCDKGNGVLVDGLIGWSETVERDVVSLAHLRGPYEATAAMVAEWCKLRDAKERERLDVRDERTQAIRGAADLLADMGVPRVVLGAEDGRKALIPTALLIAMADGLAAAGWKYDGKA